LYRGHPDLYPIKSGFAAKQAGFVGFDLHLNGDESNSFTVYESFILQT
jgi:hypothetical protein